MCASRLCSHTHTHTVSLSCPDCPSARPSALHCSQAPIMAGLVPLSSALEVMWPALQGRHHRYTHISAEILPAPAVLHRNPGEMIIMTSAHSRGEIVQLSCPSFFCFFFFKTVYFTDSIFSGPELPTFFTQASAAHQWDFILFFFPV